ncbi:hypothetical protein KMI_05g08360 [Encephalitozoon hellem]|nr:hypothetical protein KMI_05g08360 [Encephalitozoon hellem]
MRVVAEYDIKLSTETESASLYRLPSTERNLRIGTVRYKPQFKYLEMEMKLPRMRQKAQKMEGKKPNVITYESYGLRPSNTQWYGKVNHAKKIVVLRRIECVYLFSPKFGSLEGEKGDREIEGYQFRRAETREEKEHRRKNINFQIKKMNLEDFSTMEYKRREMSEDFDDAPRIPVAEDETRNIAQIRNSIVNAKVVNFSELTLLYRDQNAIKAALSRYTIFVQGRYVLSNTFYERDLHMIRDKVLELFRDKERVLCKDVYALVGGEEFLIEEICKKDGKYFQLKGFNEHTNRCGNEDMGREIAFLVEKHQPCSVETIHKEMLVDPSVIKRNLPGDVAVLANGMLATCKGDERRKKIVEMLVTKKSWKKAEVLKVAQNEPGRIEDFFEMLCEYCELKGNVWTIKE